MNDEDTLFLGEWKREGISCREIRSHRAPSRHTGLKVAAYIFAVVTVTGLVAAAPGETPSSDPIWVIPVEPRVSERVSRGMLRSPERCQATKIVFDRNVVSFTEETTK